MSATSDRERETRAFDALIVYALRREPSEAELPDAPGDLGSLLSEEDRRALAALGPDLVTRVLSGERCRPPACRGPREM